MVILFPGEANHEISRFREMYPPIDLIGGRGHDETFAVATDAAATCLDGPWDYYCAFGGMNALYGDAFQGIPSHTRFPYLGDKVTMPIACVRRGT